MLSTRQIALTGFFICLGVVTTGLILEYGENLAPCLLCHTQRILFVVVGLFFLFLFLKKNLSTYFLKFMPLIFSMFGILVSAWQVYLQNKPSGDDGICLPSLNFIWQTGSFSDVIHAVIHGTGGECAQVVWRFLGLSLAAWSLITFITLFIVSLLLFRSRAKV